MIIYSCCVGSITQGEGGVRSTTLPQLVGRKVYHRHGVSTPPRQLMLFTLNKNAISCLFFPLAELVFMAPLLLSCWRSWLWRQPGVLGWEYQHPTPPTCWTLLRGSQTKNQSPCLQQQVNPWQESEPVLALSSSHIARTFLGAREAGKLGTSQSFLPASCRIESITLSPLFFSFFVKSHQQTIRHW